MCGLRGRRASRGRRRAARRRRPRYVRACVRARSSGSRGRSRSRRRRRTRRCARRPRRASAAGANSPRSAPSADGVVEVAAPLLGDRLALREEVGLVQHPQPELDPQDVLVARRARVGDRHGEQAPEARARGVVGGLLLDAREQPARRPLQRGDQDLVLRGEVVVDRAGGDARGRGDVGDPRRREAAVEDGDARGLEDLLEALGAARVVARRAAGPAAAAGRRRGIGRRRASSWRGRRDSN